MRSLFPGHYRSSIPFEEAIKTALIVFDTNALLNFYGLSQASRKKLFDLMETLGDQRWIPHQVALEFHRNRIGLVDKNHEAYHKIPAEISAALNRIRQLCEAQDILRAEQDTTRLLDRFAADGQALIDHLQKCGTALPKHSLQDPIAEKFADLFESRVGPPPESQDALAALCENGDARYEAGIPPGFGDKNKKESYLHGKLQYAAKFGDLIIWRQILAHVKSLQAKHPRHLMYVTDDSKKDWWMMAGSNTLGPRPELAIELKEADPQWSLWMYTSSRFFQEVARIKDGKLDETVIEDVEHAAKAGQLAIAEKYFDFSEPLHDEEMTKTENALARLVSERNYTARMRERARAEQAFLEWVQRDYAVLRDANSIMPSGTIQLVVRSQARPDEMPSVLTLTLAAISPRGIQTQLEELAKHANRMANPLIATFHVFDIRHSQGSAPPHRVFRARSILKNIIENNPDVRKLAGVQISAFSPDFTVWPIDF